MRVLPAPVKQLLSRLESSDKFLVGVVTGRSLSDISGRVGLPGLIYAGNHGLEIMAPGLEFVHEAAAALASVQEEIGARLREAMVGEAGVIVEPKGLSLTVHYRMAPDSRERQINEAFGATVAPFVESRLGENHHRQEGPGGPAQRGMGQGKGHSQASGDFYRGGPNRVLRR